MSTLAALRSELRIAADETRPLASRFLLRLDLLLSAATILMALGDPGFAVLFATGWLIGLAVGYRARAGCLVPVLVGCGASAASWVARSLPAVDPSVPFGLVFGMWLGLAVYPLSRRTGHSDSTHPREPTPMDRTLVGCRARFWLLVVSMVWSIGALVVALVVMSIAETALPTAGRLPTGVLGVVLVALWLALWVVGSITVYGALRALVRRRGRSG